MAYPVLVGRLRGGVNVIANICLGLGLVLVIAGALLLARMIVPDRGRRIGCDPGAAAGPVRRGVESAAARQLFTLLKISRRAH